MAIPHPIGWTSTSNVRLLDQTLLPHEERYLELDTPELVAEAIRVLRVRGAPLIGIAAAMGVSLAARENGNSGETPLARVEAACRLIRATRPTAVNLMWAVDRMWRSAEALARSGADLHSGLVEEADRIWQEDRAMCDRIGEAGLAVLGDNATVATHCNAGALATGGIGTALAPMYKAHEAGRRVQVVASETRPLLQGARLTAWELTQCGIPCTLITDGMAASRLRRGDVDCVIVGADRIAANGDVANKIGTYALALAAQAHGVPFYVAAPRTTFDFDTPNGDAIPIEERTDEEVRGFGGQRTSPELVSIWNPAFDVTPARLIAGYITDAGLLTVDRLGQLRS
ncbi:MAG: S-methyl-5-thioribose-1-phosphate isomerase [Gemmatimonadota bacterium]